MGRLLLLIALFVPRPPVFTGLDAATTCLPGPVGGDRLVRYHLRWRAARDDRTSSSRIVYDVYRAETAGGERFAHPTYTTRPGATTFSTPLLSSSVTYYFIVRARDAAGNRDRNRREQPGTNLCL